MLRFTERRDKHKVVDVKSPRVLLCSCLICPMCRHREYMFLWRKGILPTEPENVISSIGLRLSPRSTLDPSLWEHMFPIKTCVMGERTKFED
jgi:hypothetical protein